MYCNFVTAFFTCILSDRFYLYPFSTLDCIVSLAATRETQYMFLLLPRDPRRCRWRTPGTGSSTRCCRLSPASRVSSSARTCTRTWRRPSTSQHPCCSGFVPSSFWDFNSLLGGCIVFLGICTLFLGVVSSSWYFFSMPPKDYFAFFLFGG